MNMNIIAATGKYADPWRVWMAENILWVNLGMGLVSALYVLWLVLKYRSRSER